MVRVGTYVCVRVWVCGYFGGGACVNVCVDVCVRGDDDVGFGGVHVYLRVCVCVDVGVGVGGVNGYQSKAMSAQVSSRCAQTGLRMRLLCGAGKRGDLCACGTVHNMSIESDPWRI